MKDDILFPINKFLPRPSSHVVELPSMSTQIERATTQTLMTGKVLTEKCKLYDDTVLKHKRSIERKDERLRVRIILIITL